MMRIRFIQVAGLLVALCCMSLLGSTTVAQDKQPSPSKPKTTASEAEAQSSVSTLMTQKVRASLDKYGNFQYDEVPFVDVQADLEKQFGSNIVIDQTAIDDALTEEELVTINLKNVRYCDGLRILLRNYNATYVIQNGIIRIISLANVDDPDMHTRIMLDVQPTLDLIRKYDGRMDSGKFKELEKCEISKMILSEAIGLVGELERSCADVDGHATLEIAGGILIVRGPELLLSEVKDFVQDLHAQLESRSHKLSGVSTNGTR